ncbi:hypothetical protein [Pseudomaricurvus sp. HS19]|uniref:hypothetical protein n=1 Tax=Pseudomaricurvus sp. HS19 TaxID=2692626 RepID=UPI00136B675D|nr:hypothetical protein [Pseudomaricurvus sp. HS19]MYM64332.1 hypothetical protein [Pseudomaricurvus sp. HS19]
MATFDIIFRGDLMPGFQLADVKRNLASLFKADAARIDALFSGAATPLKRGLDEATAQKYLAVLKKAGADVQLAAEGSVGAGRRRAAAAAPPPQPSAAKPSMQERLAAQAQTAPAVAAVSQPEVKPATAAAASGLSLAPVGTTLVEPARAEAPVAPDIGHLSLRAQEGNLVDGNEIERPVPVAVNELNVSLREAGASLLDEGEREIKAVVAVADLGAELAPAGSDLGQIRRPPPPPAPDTSAIQLLDN